MEQIEQAITIAETIMMETKSISIETNILDLLKDINRDARIIELLLREFLGTQKA